MSELGKVLFDSIDMDCLDWMPRLNFHFDFFDSKGNDAMTNHNFVQSKQIGSSFSSKCAKKGNKLSPKQEERPTLFFKCLPLIKQCVKHTLVVCFNTICIGLSDCLTNLSVIGSRISHLVAEICFGDSKSERCVFLWTLCHPVPAVLQQSSDKKKSPSF